MKSVNKCVGILLLVIIGLMLSGCTPKKARELRTVAVQFKVEALSAIDAIDILMRKEFESVPRTNTQYNENLKKAFLAWNPNKQITPDVIEFWKDPYNLDINLDKWNKKLYQLRKDYTTFAAIFKDIEHGSFFVAKAVEKAKPHAERLAMNMSASAKSISDHPPKLLQYQTSVTTRLTVVNNSPNLSDEEKWSQGSRLIDEWDKLGSMEQDLGRKTVEKCLKAALLGIELVRLMDEYKTLSLDDISFIVNMVLSEAGAISGEDLSGLKIKSDEVFAEIKKDPVWTNMADRVLNEINDIREDKSTKSDDLNNSEETGEVSISSESTNVVNTVDLASPESANVEP